MASIPSSPAVVVLERDNSSYAPNIDSSIVGIVGYATKGPENIATLITSQENLLNTFGPPLDTLPGQGLEGALEMLETTNQVRYVRAVAADALEASATILMGVCPAVMIEPPVNNNGVGWGVIGGISSLYLRVQVKDSDGIERLAPTVFSVLSSINAPVALGQANALASVLGNGNNPLDPFSIQWNPDVAKTTLGIGSNYGCLVGSWAGSGSTMSVSSYSGTADGTTYGLVSSIRIMSTASGAPDLALGLSSTLTSVVGFNLSSVGLSGLSYLAKSLYKGSGYNLGIDLNTGQTSGINIEVVNNAGAHSQLIVNEEGVYTEAFRVSLLDGPSFVEQVINTGIVNRKSQFIKGEIQVAGFISGTPNGATSFSNRIGDTIGISVLATAAGVSATPRFVKLIQGTYPLLSGTLGTMVEATDLIGNSAAKTGIYGLDDDTLNISIAIVPGIATQAVQNALITLAETSQNFVAVIAPPFGLSNVQAVTDWMNGRGGTGRTSAINSSWVAIYWPWVQVFNPFTGNDTWYDPAIFAVRQMTLTDNVAEPWFAPAGFRRGRLTKPSSTEKQLNQGDRDALYTTNINPIVNFVPDGITIFGQKTCQRLATAVDRINVRRLMIYLRKTLLASGRIDLFEPNDSFTWDSVKSKADQILSDIQNRRGIVQFKVICDSTVNTPLRVDRNELWCKILLKPTKTAEFIVFEVNLTSQAGKIN